MKLLCGEIYNVLGIWKNKNKSQYKLYCHKSSVSSVTQSCPTLCDPMDSSTPGFPVHHQLPELTQRHVHSIGDAIQPSQCCRPLLLPPSIFPSIMVFSDESVLCIRWPKYWSFSFNISPSNEHPGLVSFRMDWLDLLAVQGTRKSLLQHNSSKASIPRRSAFFIVHIHTTTFPFCVSFSWGWSWSLPPVQY